MVPLVPPNLPSDLLELRPDIAAAFFPILMLSASGGYNSASLENWFNTPSRV